MKLVLATRNDHKAARVRRRCWRPTRSGRCPPRLSCRPRPASTFAENALGKARAAAERPGRWSSPTTRGSRPPRSAGVPASYSARFAGEDATDEENLAKLLAGGAAPAARCLCLRDRARRSGRGHPTALRGSLYRHVGGPSHAESGGFGYDPAFVPDDEIRRRQGARWPSSRRPRRARSAIAAVPRALLAEHLGP